MTTVYPPIEQCVPGIRRMTNNIVRVYDQATRLQKKNGRVWYDLAHLWAVEHGGTAERGAGVIAALAPNASWIENKRLALRAFNDGVATGHTKLNCEKANRILSGDDPLDVLSGKKVISFYSLIVDPKHVEAVCVDRHAFDVALGDVQGGKPRFLERSGGYELIAKAYRLAATRTKLRPSQLQAVTWLVWRSSKWSAQSDFAAF